MQMANKVKLCWGVWIASVSAIFVYLYALSPLAPYNISWMAFIAVPIYFNEGARRVDFIPYTASMLVGIVWALIYLYFINLGIRFGLSNAVSTGLCILIITTFLTVTHFILLANTWLTKVAMMFGSIASVFSQNGENLIPIMLTLFGGIILGLSCAEGLPIVKRLLNAEEPQGATA